LTRLVQEGEDIVCLGGTGNAYKVAREEGDCDRSYVIEDAVNTAFRCPTPHQPLFHRNQFSSCLLLNISLAFQNSNGFFDMAKQRPAHVKDRPRFKSA
jgi:hypothetical protein